MKSFSVLTKVKVGSHGGELFLNPFAFRGAFPILLTDVAKRKSPLVVVIATIKFL